MKINYLNINKGHQYDYTRMYLTHRDGGYKFIYPPSVFHFRSKVIQTNLYYYKL